ncbi:MAG: S49 family peptidase [Thiotrichaceae bacterium]
MSDAENNAIKALEKVALEGIQEQRRTRRWGIFFKIAFLVWGILLLVGFIGSIASQGKILTSAKEFTAVVDVKGVIMDGSDAGFTSVASALKDAFEDSRTKGVVLRINSPGGSAVQSAMIYDEVKRLKKEYADIPVYAVIQDVGASGGYFIAASADEIYANRSSIVGSIGVRLDSYGVVEAAKKLGIESRLVTAGDHKAILDPFQPLSEVEQQHLKKMLESTHKEFINSVREGRGDRLKENPDTFSGLFWTGSGAKEQGLVDGFMTTSQVARELIKAEELVSFTREKTLLDKLSGKVGASLSQLLLGAKMTQGFQY